MASSAKALPAGMMRATSRADRWDFIMVSERGFKSSRGNSVNAIASQPLIIRVLRAQVSDPHFFGGDRLKRRKGFCGDATNFIRFEGRHYKARHARVSGRLCANQAILNHDALPGRASKFSGGGQKNVWKRFTPGNRFAADQEGEGAAHIQLLQCQ